LGAQAKEIVVDDDNVKVQIGKLKECVEELTFLESVSKKSLSPLTEILSNVKGYEDNNDDSEGYFVDLFGDDKTLEKSICNDENGFESAGETTIEDEIILNSISRLSLMGKENPPSVVKTSRKDRRSSNQSNISVLEFIGSPISNSYMK